MCCKKKTVCGSRNERHGSHSHVEMNFTAICATIIQSLGLRTPFSIWSLIGHLATRIWTARYLQKQYLGTGTLLRGTRIPTFEFGL